MQSLLSRNCSQASDEKSPVIGHNGVIIGYLWAQKGALTNPEIGTLSSGLQADLSDIKHPLQTINNQRLHVLSVPEQGFRT